MSYSSKPFRCVVLGAQSLLIQCGEILLSHGHTIKAVVADDPAIMSWARDHDLRLIDPNADLLASLSSESFEYLFSITNLAIIPDAVIALPENTAINFHDGPLPRYAGLNTPAWALMNGESEYGISFHEMTAEIDGGRILKQKLFPISADETSLSINTKCFEAGIKAFDELVGELATNTVEPRVQDAAKRSHFGKFDRPEGLAILDPARPAIELERLVRALDFGPYENPLAAAKLANHGRSVLVRSASLIESGAAGQLGEISISEVGDESLALTTADGVIAIGRFATLSGSDLSREEALEWLGLSSGGVLGGPNASEREHLTKIGSRVARSESFWTRRLARLEPLNLPYVHSERSRTGSGDWEERTIDVPDAYRARYAEIVSADAVASGVAAYLGRIGGQEHFTIAFRDAVQANEIESAQPWVAEWVPLRITQGASAEIGVALESTAVEIERVRKRGSWLRDVVARFPSLATFDLGTLVRFGIEIGEPLPIEREPSQAEIRLTIAADGSNVRLRYDARLVDPADASAMANQLGHFLSALSLSEDSETLGSLSLLDSAEREKILHDWNDTEVDYPQDICVHDLFARQVDRRPDATALIFEDRELSYAELDERANRLANHLQSMGLGPDSFVGIYVERSFDMMVSILGVQKAGGAYVPLDPNYPSDRIALMIEDSGAAIVLTQTHLISTLPEHQAQIVCVDVESPEMAQQPTTRPSSGTTPSNLAYMIYTSGSTGRPKGVKVEHRNVVNFFTGMDRVIDHDPSSVWLAVTSLSFDISVLELLWTLTRGFKVVIYADDKKSAGPAVVSNKPMDFGLFMWGAGDTTGRNKYELMLESARYGDRNGFSSFWTPERHFHAFGGPYPNPAVTGAAVAAVTERIAIRAGSCVLPLHMPIRVAEEWAAVDNLSNGRVGMAFAAGWQPNDFVIRPESYKEAKANLFRDLDVVKKLWRGETVDFANPMGNSIPIATQPRPVQKDLPTWITTAGNPETFRMAGEVGANLLTHLLGQTVEEVGEKIRVYREARARAGYDPDTGIVTLMLHTLVGEDDVLNKERARAPMKSYLGSSMSLVKDFAWAFPAFRRPGGANSTPDAIDIASLTEEENDAILDFAFERYYETSGLFGSVETCVAMIEKVKSIGVDEIGCLIDYGVHTDIMLESLELLNEVRKRSNKVRSGDEESQERSADQSLPAQVKRHAVSHIQCTPSMARMLVIDEDAHPILKQIDHLMIGGESLPLALAHDLDGLVDCKVTNMYGPTETTIWSSTAPVYGKPDRITIGRPIANTQFYILDRNLEPVPIGAVGELMIGGDGVVRGYHERPDLTAERFISNPFSNDREARLYRTGDQARWNQDGTVDFLGRMDHQVKIRGYRVELGEIESRLAQHESIRDCVAIVREDTPSDQRLVAYLIAHGSQIDPDELKTFLGESLPEFMIPSAFSYLEQLPLTPNAKVDRKALPPPEALSPRSKAEYVAPESGLELHIAEVWKDVLKIDDVGARDNFFDLGGHSLLVVQVHRALREKVDQPISLTDLYRFPTIHALAEHFRNDDGSSAAAGAGQDRAEKRKAARTRRRRLGTRK